MITLCIGDTHGHMDDLLIVAFAAIYYSNMHADQIVQVGDFGYWPNSEISYGKRTVLKNIPQHPKYLENVKMGFIDGNHEHFDDLSAGVNHQEQYGHIHPEYKIEHIKRGEIKDTILHMGGAISVDRANRTAGHYYFSDEAIKIGDLYQAIDNVENLGMSGKIKTIISHDTGQDAFESGMKDDFKNDVYSTNNRKMLQSLIDEVKPKLVVHGHYHRSSRYEHNGTTYVCLDTTTRGSLHKILDTHINALAIDLTTAEEHVINNILDICKKELLPIVQECVLFIDSEANILWP